MMSGPSSRPTAKTPIRSPNKRRPGNENPETPTKTSETKEKKNIPVSPLKSMGSPRPTSASRGLKKTGSVDSKGIDISLKSVEKQKKTGTFSRLSTPRANQMKDDSRSESASSRLRRHGDHEVKRSSSTPKSLNRARTTSDTKDKESKSIIGKPAVRRFSKPFVNSSTTTSPVASAIVSPKKEAKLITPTSTISNKESHKDEPKPSLKKQTIKQKKEEIKLVNNSSKKKAPSSESSGLSRAQKAEEKHRKRVTLAQGGVKHDAPLTKRKPSNRTGLRRSQVRTQSALARTRIARSSQQDFTVEGDEAMAMAGAILGAIGSSGVGGEDEEEDDDDEEGDRVEMTAQWQRNLEKNAPSTPNKDDDELPSEIHMMKKSVHVPSFAHIHAGPSPEVITRKDVLSSLSLKTKLEASMPSSPQGAPPQTADNHDDDQGISKNSRSRSATVGTIQDDAYQKTLSNALKTTSSWSSRVKEKAIDLVHGGSSKSRSASITSGDVGPSRMKRTLSSWTFIDDAMEALSPGSRRASMPNSSARSPTSTASSSPVNSPNGNPSSPSSPMSNSSFDSTVSSFDSVGDKEDSLVHSGWLQVYESGSLFNTGWRRRYLMLIRGGRMGTGPRGLGSLLILRKKPTNVAMATIVKPNSENVENKDLCKEINLNGADLALHYDKVPNGTFGFLLTHTRGGDLPLTAPSRELRQSWLNELRIVMKRTNNVDGSFEGNFDKVTGRKGTKNKSVDDVNVEQRSAKSMPRPNMDKSVLTQQKWKPAELPIKSPLTSTLIASPRAVVKPPVKSRPGALDVNQFASVVQSPKNAMPDFNDPQSPPFQALGPPKSPHSPASPLTRTVSFHADNRGADRSHSAPSQRPPGAPSPSSPSLLSPKMSGSASASVPLEWQERMRRASPAHIEDVNWDNLVALATPDDFKYLGKGAGVSSVIVANTGGAVFFAFFKRTPRSETLHDEENQAMDTTISTVHEDDEHDSEEEPSRRKRTSSSPPPVQSRRRTNSDPSRSQSRRRTVSSETGGAIRSRVREINKIAKGPSARSSRNSTEIEMLADFGTLDIDNDIGAGAVSHHHDSDDDNDSIEDADNEVGVLGKPTELSDLDSREDEEEDGDEMDEDEEEEEEDLTEQVCILKFCRNVMDTQAEFCANQMAMALHIQVPSCRIMRKKDDEWDQLAAAAFTLRRSVEVELGPWATVSYEALEASLNDTSCGLVFELVHTGSSLKLEHITAALEADKEREEALSAEAPGMLTTNAPPMPPSLLQLPKSSDSDSVSNMDHNSGSRASFASAPVDALHLDPTRLGLPASTSFQSPSIAGVLTGGVFNHRRQTLISASAQNSSASGTSGTNSMKETSYLVEEVGEGADFRQEYLEKDIGEIVGETLVFDLMIRNPDRFPCAALGWRGNLDNVMWVERSPFSGTRTLWVIDSSIPRRPLRLHVRDDKKAIPRLIRQALLGEQANPGRNRGGSNAPEPVLDSYGGVVEDSIRETSKLLYSLVGGDPEAQDATTMQHLLLFDKQVPAFRTGIRRSLHRCRKLLEQSLQPLHTTLQDYFDEVSVEVENLAKSAKDKLEKENSKEEEEKKQHMSDVAAVVVKEVKTSKKERPGGGFRQRFNTGDVRMFNLKKEEREALEGSDDETSRSRIDSSSPPPPPPPTSSPPIEDEQPPKLEQTSKTTPPPSSRMTPVISQMGKKWTQAAKNRDRSGSKPLEMIRQTPEVEKPEMTERDATVVVINNWTRKFWDTGKALEARFDEYAIAQMQYEEKVLEASEELVEKQQKLADTATIASNDGADDMSLASSSQFDDDTMAMATSVAEAAAATTELMEQEPDPVFVTGFIDSGSTNCFAGAYELKIRLEHICNRLRIIMKTLDEIDST